ncbi:MAG: hypothetical protein LBD77_06275 [Bifidobacteriaceae bacterium]|jgi:hypothetical protein|nr:hypothetical protein [Bifidobacteriaceae bacterium]
MRKSPAVHGLCLGLASLLALGAGGCGGSDEAKITDPRPDDGAAVLMVQPDTPDNGLDRELETTTEPEDFWLSAPWAVAVAPSADADEIVITYVDGDTQCYAHTGFTVDETDSKVTIGAYVGKVAGAGTESGNPCPDNPARAFKWGTVKLKEPLGERELFHAGLAELFQDFTWPVTAPASEAPAEGSEGAEGAEGAGQAEDGQ